MHIILWVIMGFLAWLILLGCLVGSEPYDVKKDVVFQEKLKAILREKGRVSQDDMRNL